jgi:Family of unknown function (DUF6328)
MLAGPMKLESVLKTSLDELRMQMLGSQVLFGFQFQGLFQDNFEALPISGRTADGVAMALMTLVLGLILAVPCQHRIVDGGASTLRILRVSSSYANYALGPLAAAIACDIYVATVHTVGNTRGVALALGAFTLAIGAWYGLGTVMRGAWNTSRGLTPMKETPTHLHEKIEQLLTEARVILPGAQALLGFQLIVMMAKSFDRLPPLVQAMHVIALMGLVIAVALLIAPAALHRLALQGRDDAKLLGLGSLVITLALLPLAASICCDVWVALFKLTGSDTLPTVGALVTAALLLVMWFALPLYLRGTMRAHRRLT